MDILHSAATALLLIVEPHRLMLLFAGVCMGLAIGILPGIGGVAGTALLLPFTYGMDPAAAIAILLGLAASTTTADPISAIVLGAPGHAASAATTLDGYPMTKRGEGGRALGAAYMSAMIGGLFGAVLLAVVLPVIKPFILLIGSPELLALAVFGISMVAVLSGNAPLRGLTCACFGMMLAMIGSDPQTGTLRWTLGSLYLWDGLPLVPLTLGIFALPELCDLLISRVAVVSKEQLTDNRRGLLEGARDCFRNWFLVLRCAWIGSAMGAIPGIGAAVIDWISYGHALRTEKDAQKTFGTGDVRGVIAAESATSSREGGALIPTIVFGVPASSGMAILLGAFLMHGLVPGPEMLTKNLDITYSMVWSIAIANLLGSGLCFAFSGQLAKLATLRYTLVLPVVLCLVYIGAFEGKRQWGDLYSLLIFGVIGWVLKHLKWPRPPLVLGFILGGMLERYLFISIERYGGHWVARPAVVVILALAGISLLRPLVKDAKTSGGLKKLLSGFSRPRFRAVNLLAVFFIAVFLTMLAQAWSWEFSAKVVPMIVGGTGLGTCVLALLTESCRRRVAAGAIEANAKSGMAQKIHMDIASNIDHLSVATRIKRALLFFAWMGFFLGSMSLIGTIPTVPIFIVTFMRVERRERWTIVIPMALVMTVFLYFLFDQLLGVKWPSTVLGDWSPWLKAHIPSM
jgi:TctA family transporter